ncbi:hypothetical protein G6F22_014062 [Rhizopus arrhizus]|nr:hypothetical protein G6F22_014062 [Rhizopus arrhizus]
MDVRHQESNQRNTPPGREPVLRTGTLRSSARRGTARELAALKHPRLFALAGPAVLGSLEGGPNSRALIRCRGFERSARLLPLLSCSIPWRMHTEAVRGRAGGLGRGIRAMDGAAKPPGTDLRRPLRSLPARTAP